MMVDLLINDEGHRRNAVGLFPTLISSTFHGRGAGALEKEIRPSASRSKGVFS